MKAEGTVSNRDAARFTSVISKQANVLHDVIALLHAAEEQLIALEDEDAPRERVQDRAHNTCRLTLMANEKVKAVIAELTAV